MPPLFRSLILWSGVLLLLALSMLWADSRENARVLNAHRNVFVQSITLSHGRGSIEFGYQHPSSGSAHGPWDFRAHREPLARTLKWFPAPNWLVKEYPAVYYYELRIPYWLLMVLTLVACSALLFWRGWRRRQIARENLAIAGEVEA